MLSSSKDRKTEAVQVDYELFTKAFQKPTQLYKLLGFRHHINPIFLHRTTSYMKHRRTSQTYPSKSIDAVIKELQKKAHDLDRCKFKEGRLKITITGIDNKCSSDLIDKYEVEVHLHKINCKENSASSCYQTDCPVAKLKFSRPHNKSHSGTKSPYKAPVTFIRYSTLANKSSSLGCILEFRVKLRLLPSISSKSSSPPTKKRKCEGYWYSACVVVQNESQTSVLGDGSYTLFLRPLLPPPPTVESKHWECAAREQIGDFKKNHISDDIDENSTISFEVKSEDVVTPSSQPCSPQRSQKTNLHVSCESTASKRDTSRGVLMYNFLYNGNTMQQTECRKNKVCPWCNLDCRLLYCLLEHITQCHPKFKVKFIPGLNGFDEIEVEVNEVPDLLGNPMPDEEENVPIFSGPNRRTSFGFKMSGSLTRCSRSERDFMVLDIAPYKIPHTRLYFRSKTYEPILPHEFDYDSDNDEQMLWMEDKTKQLIRDFTDVNSAEKSIMILWNCFVLKARPLADQEVPVLAMKFVEEQGREVIRQNLTRNLTLHLINLHSFGLLTPDELENVVVKLHSIDCTIGSAKHN